MPKSGVSSAPADDLSHIETTLQGYGLSIGMLLREVARRFHGVEIPPPSEVKKEPDNA